MTARRAAGIVLAVLALSGAGCSSGPPNAGSPLPPLASPAGGSATPSASPVGSASVGSAPPSPSPDPAGDLRADAEAFVRGYFAEVNRAAMTNDTSRLPALSSPGCRICRDDLARIQSRAARGLHVDRELYVLDSVEAGQPQGNLVSVSIIAAVQASRLLDSAEHERALGDAQPRTQSALSLARGETGWVIQDVHDFGPTS